MSEQRNHLDVAELHDLLETGGSPAVAQHLAECTECKIRAARLARSSGMPTPSTSALERILASNARLSQEFVEAIRVHPQSDGPAAGELWRVGDGESLLVWVRRVLDGASEVMPVVLDVDLADDHTLLLPASSSNLGLELALVTSVRGHVHPDAFLSRVDALDATVAEHVSEVMRADREGRVPTAVLIGTPVYDADDQRVEFQQTLADLLADFGPGRWPVEQSMSADREQREAQSQAWGGGEFLTGLRAELTHRHPCQVLPSLRVEAPLPPGPSLRAVARVSYTNAAVIVAVRRDWQSESFADLAAACSSIVRQEPGAVAVAICGDDAERLALVFNLQNMTEAYEPPAGLLRPPEPVLGPMGLVDVLHKYLDTRVPAWEAIDVGQDLMAIDLPAAIRSAAQAAVAGVIAQGASARTPAKKEAWQSVSPTDAERIADLLEQVVEGKRSSDAVDRLIEGGQE